MILRFHNYREIFATLKLADNIEGMHTYMMGVEELFINLVLISYLFAVKDNMVANEKGTSEDTDDELKDIYPNETMLIPSGENCSKSMQNSSKQVSIDA
jgi:hypothetical protein